LSDDADGRSPSFLAHKRSQSLLGRRESISSDLNADNVEIGPSWTATEPIVEASEPPSPEAELDAPPLESPSLLARALKMYDQATRAPGKSLAQGSSPDSSATEVEREQRPPSFTARLSHTSVISDAAHPTETTPLIRGRSHTIRPHNGSDGNHDVESQKPIYPQHPGGSDRHKDLSFRRGFVYSIQLLSEPKRWDRKQVWQNAVVTPISYLPAVTVGLLLNILDALSYGKLQVDARLRSLPAKLRCRNDPLPPRQPSLRQPGLRRHLYILR